MADTGRGYWAGATAPDRRLASVDGGFDGDYHRQQKGGDPTVKRRIEQLERTKNNNKNVSTNSDNNSKLTNFQLDLFSCISSSFIPLLSLSVSSLLLLLSLSSPRIPLPVYQQQTGIPE